MQSGNGAAGRRQIRRLGHIGLYVRDLEKVRDFYRDVLGLTVTDQDVERGIVFMSARPDEEHHELALVRGRETDDSVPMVQQVSWQVDSLEAVLAFHTVFKERGVNVRREVTHGNAISIYFSDPEENQCEVYYSVNEDVLQPFSRPINLEQSSEDVLAESRRLVEEADRFRQPVGGRSG